MFICTFYHTPVAFCDRGIVFYITKGVSLMRHPLPNRQRALFHPLCAPTQRFHLSSYSYAPISSLYVEISASLSRFGRFAALKKQAV